MRGFLDTNILLYSISTDVREREKAARARALLDEDGWGLSTQVLQEFYVQATRASRSDPLPHDLAAGFLRVWQRFRIEPVTMPIVLRALDLRASYGFSYWDSAILAAALAMGAPVILSEDLSHGQVVEGLRIENPFR